MEQSTICGMYRFVLHSWQSDLPNLTSGGKWHIYGNAPPPEVLNTFSRKTWAGRLRLTETIIHHSGAIQTEPLGGFRTASQSTTLNKTLPEMAEDTLDQQRHMAHRTECQRGRSARKQPPGEINHDRLQI